MTSKFATTQTSWTPTTAISKAHKEIADYLDISVTAAKVRLHRAHQKLRQILEEVER